ncbi:hypothetical protein D9756_004100 [Leucocoprinus leucothites]|uniref:F-box domain-containing protein n=1 Tax=Leucocoprinus leucothites TaxID=201217 RepID=A0A8H5FZX4_9AGAR|nr:hypothetical protein D9756_004100 [Leucoagaricus leucothites]
MIGTPEEFGKAVGDRLPFTLNSSHMAELVATMSPEEQEAFAVRIARIRNRLRLQDAGRAVRERSTKDNEVNLEVANPSTFAPPSTFLSFPLELIDRVLCNLDLRSLLKCKEVCKELKEHVERAKGIQSIMELEIYGQEMNPDNDWSATKVSQCLRQYQSTWEKPNWTDRDGDPITAPMENGGLWELSGGVLAQTDEDGHFHFRKFPSTTRHIQQETWDIIPDIPDICDFGMDPGQDLLVWITAPTPVLPTLSLYVRTLRMGDRHPLAREQVICYDHYLVRDYWSYSIKIMQDYIGLLAHYRPTLDVIDGVGRTEFMIWNWKEGKLELDLLTPRTQSFAFVPNRHVVLADLCDGPFGEDETEIYLTLIDFRAEGATKKSLGEVRNAIKLCYPIRAEDTVYSELDISSDPAPGWTPGKDDKSPFYVAKENRVFAVTIVAITGEGRDAAFRHFIPLSWNGRSGRRLVHVYFEQACLLLMSGRALPSGLDA